MKKYVYFLFLGIIGCHSKYSYKNVAQVAQDYCACMQRKNPTNDTMEYWYAKKVCDGLTIEQHFFFRLMEVDRRFNRDSLSSSLLDSIAHFEESFEAHLRTHCCKSVGTCKLGAKRPSDPRLGL